MKLRYAAIFFLLPVVQPAIAHHSSFPHFDADRPVVLEGVVAEFKFVNPHAYVYLDVTDEDGVVTKWNCEMGAASSLRRFGWSADLFKPGTVVTIDGVMARRDPQGCSFVSGILADGTRVARNGPLDRSSSPPAAAEEPVAAEGAHPMAGNWEPPMRGRRPDAAGREGGADGRGGGGQSPVGRAGPPQQRTPPEMTAAGEAAAAAFDAIYDDPGLECSPSSIIRAWGESGMINQIEVLDDTIIIRHQYMDLERTVHLATQKPPDGFEPSLAGYSIGHFEADDLLIETTGFKAGVLQAHVGDGLLHTADMQVTERLSLSDDGMQLIRESVVLDPAYYIEPMARSQTWNRSTRPFEKFNCVELSGLSKERPVEE